MKIDKIILLRISSVFLLMFAAGCALLENENVGEGRKLFGYYCSSCHGEKGMGDGFNSVNLDPTPRDLTDSKEVYLGKQKNEDLFKVLTLGGGAIEKSTRMPLYKYTLSEKEIWQVIAFLRTLHSHDTEDIDFTKEMKIKPEKKEGKTKKIGSKDFKKKNKRAMLMGKKSYKKTGCSACHKIGEKGGTVGPDLTHIGSRLNAAWMYKFFLNPQRLIKHVKMPNYGLKDKVAFNMAYYLQSLKKKE